MKGAAGRTLGTGTTITRSFANFCASESTDFTMVCEKITRAVVLSRRGKFITLLVQESSTHGGVDCPTDRSALEG